MLERDGLVSSVTLSSFTGEIFSSNFYISINVNFEEGGFFFFYKYFILSYVDHEVDANDLPG